ncbi:uncharacterized protein LOC134272762 [Saccostrea cucullata]|uniref:uncharacterized protein LOC134265218 n=1 Tax=Saccostrea cuccullata TaxID=36930 RepID=UPI002ED5B176
MYYPKLHKSMTVNIVKGFRGVWQISCVPSGGLWISDGNNLTSIMTNAYSGFQDRTDIGLVSYGIHTVKTTCSLIYIDREFNINQLSTDIRKKYTLIERNKPWIPLCVYSSRFNGDILVGMLNTTTWAGRVMRYDTTGQYIMTIQHNGTGQDLYNLPSYITENRNGDVIVSDLTDIDINDYGCGAVVVTDLKGRHRFSYKGYPSSGSELWPRGICTDALSCILVCDSRTNTIHIIDKDGNFVWQMETQNFGIDVPIGLSYDNKSQLLWVGSLNNKVCAIK